MAQIHVINGPTETPIDLTVRKIGLDDIRDALAHGLDDFAAMPSHVIFLGLIYPIVGFVLARMAFGYDVLPLLYPLSTGFALVGPLRRGRALRAQPPPRTGARYRLDARVRHPQIAVVRAAILALGALLMRSSSRGSQPRRRSIDPCSACSAPSSLHGVCTRRLHYRRRLGTDHPRQRPRLCVRARGADGSASSRFRCCSIATSALRRRCGPRYARLPPTR